MKVAKVHSSNRSTLRSVPAEDGVVIGAASTEPGTTTVTWSWSLGSSEHRAIGAVSIKPR